MYPIYPIHPNEMEWPIGQDSGFTDWSWTEGNWADVDESMTMSTRPTEVVSAVRQWMTINFHLIGFIWKSYSSRCSLCTLLVPFLRSCGFYLFPSSFCHLPEKSAPNFIVFTIPLRRSLWMTLLGIVFRARHIFCDFNLISFDGVFKIERPITKIPFKLDLVSQICTFSAFARAEKIWPHQRFFVFIRTFMNKFYAAMSEKLYCNGRFVFVFDLVGFSGNLILLVYPFTISKSFPISQVNCLWIK